LEQARAAGIIGHSLDAKVSFESRNGDRNSILTGLVLDDRNRLQDLLIVSQADILGDSLGAAGVEASVYEATQLNCRILVRKADGAKCTRCWKYDPAVGKDPTHPTVCARCASVLNAGEAA
jgi:isoleucyl-tRNA synthetase